jgi:uncharacterized damage-inducible protein DinB
MTDVRTPGQTRPDRSEHAPYYGTYIAHVPDGDIVATLDRQFAPDLALLRAIPEARGEDRYAEGKWSIREVIGHLIDAERVFTYRAMRFARNDATPLPSFDEQAFVANAHFNARTIASLCDEWAAVRQATRQFFGSLLAEEWDRAGTASNARMSVRALAWVIAGHELHHLSILKERYGIG